MSILFFIIILFKGLSFKLNTELCVKLLVCTVTLTSWWQVTIDSRAVQCKLGYMTNKHALYSELPSDGLLNITVNSYSEYGYPSS